MPTSRPPPGPPGSGTATPFALDGAIADVAVYPAPLSAAQVQAHAGDVTPPTNQPPTAAFDVTCTALACDLIARRSGTTSQYQAKLRVLSTGAVSVAIVKLDGSSTETAITAASTVGGLSVSAGTPLRVRFQATGASPTTLRLKVWQDGTSEPAGWQATGTDSSAALQDAGSVALGGYLSGSATNPPVTARFATFSAVTPE